MKIRPRTSAVLGSALALVLLAGAAEAQDQFRFGESSVGRSRDDAAARGPSRDAAPLRTQGDRARGADTGRSNAFRNDSSRNARYHDDDSRSDRGRDNGGRRSAIDPDGDGRGLSYNDRTIWDRNVLQSIDSRHDDRRSGDRDNHGRGSRDRYSDRASWDDDCDDWSGSRTHISFNTHWSNRDFYRGTYGCDTAACAGCASCLPYSYGCASLTDPWDCPAPPVVYVDQPVYVPAPVYVQEPVVITPPVAAPAPVVITYPVVVYATTDVSNAILAADAGAHARAVFLLRAYAQQHARLPDPAELGPAARAALVSVRRTYERASLAPGATTDTLFMLAACRALMYENDLALAAIDASIAAGDTQPSTAALRAHLSR